MAKTERMNKLIELIRKKATSGPVCDNLEKCKDWEEAMPQIDNAIVVSCVSHGLPYTGKNFRFCPWCGSPINRESKSDKLAEQPQVHKYLKAGLADWHLQGL